MGGKCTYIVENANGLRESQGSMITLQNQYNEKIYQIISRA